jgi:hypothetical protein
MRMNELYEARKKDDEEVCIDRVIKSIKSSRKIKKTEQRTSVDLKYQYNIVTETKWSS